MESSNAAEISKASTVPLPETPVETAAPTKPEENIGTSETPSEQEPNSTKEPLEGSIQK